MTGYHISLGYMSSCSSNGNWQFLKDLANNITRKELLDEYLKYDDITTCEDGCCHIDDFIEKFFTRDDNTISFIEDVDEDEQPQIMLLASGGGLSREMKEGTRRAFCRLLMMKAHKARVEITINVA